MHLNPALGNVGTSVSIEANHFALKSRKSYETVIYSSNGVAPCHL